MKQKRFLAVFLCLCLMLTACGAEAPMDNSAAYDRVEFGRTEMPAETMAASEALKTDASTGLSTAAQTNRKLIKTVSMDAETENYDALVTTLEETITALGGYTENRRTGTYGRSRRWSSMTIRIPAENLSSFVAHVGENANVLSTSETTEDVTLQYVDTEAKIAALETEQTRLMELLENAQNLGEILEIEARLSDVTYELERYASQKRSYDNLVTYATVHLSVEEVEILTPVEEPTVWNRISTGFMESLEGVGDALVDTFVFLIAGSPYIVVTGAVVALIVLLAKKQSRKTQNTKQSTDSETP